MKNENERAASSKDVTRDPKSTDQKVTSTFGRANHVARRRAGEAQ